MKNNEDFIFDFNFINRFVINGSSKTDANNNCYSPSPKES